jgi:hypothetical protein
MLLLILFKLLQEKYRVILKTPIGSQMKQLKLAIQSIYTQNQGLIFKKRM